MSGTNTYSITRISNSGVSTEAEALNRFNGPIGEIETALGDLSGRINALNNKCAVLYEHAPLSASCRVGTLVYYDVVNAVFAPAIATLNAEPGEQGETVEADSARVVGLVIRIDPSGTDVQGTLLCGGAWNDGEVASACLGVAARRGTYYLSATEAGTAVTEAELHGRLRQGVLTYLGNGLIVFGLHYMAHENHWHSSHTLGGWLALSQLPQGISAPAGANWLYDRDNDAGASTLGELSARTTAVFYNGLLQRPGENFVIDNSGNLWCNNTSMPDNGSVVVFNSYPFVYNGPIVRAVVSDNDALTVTNKNGTIVLSQNGFVSGGARRSQLAVSAISGKNILYTPVVTGISAGPGLSVSLSGDGVATVSASSMVGALHDAYVVDHNGTNQANDGVYPYIMFPAGRASSLTITMPVVGLPDTTRLDAKVWLMAMSAGTYATSTRWLPQPAAGSAVALSSVTPTSDTISGGSSGSLTYLETSQAVRITGNGTLVTTIATSGTPVNDCSVFRVGYKFSLVDAEVAESEVSKLSAVTGSGRAAVAIEKHVAVRANGSSGLVSCGSGTAANADECLGVSLHATSMNGICDYVASGIIADPSWSWTPGAAIYVGPTGTLTQTNPSTNSQARFVQRIGTALTTSIVQIAIEPATLK